MNKTEQIVRAVQGVYDWLHVQIPADFACEACGTCCDFPKYGHRLYITSPELIYFREKMGAENIRPAENGLCPYHIDGRCSVHDYRFGGCRIFYCKDKSTLACVLSETAIENFKRICDQYNLPYAYLELAPGLERLRNGEIQVD